MPNVRTDITISLDGFICGLAAQQPPYLDKGFFRITEWVVEHLVWRERAGFDGGLQDADDALLAEMFEQAGAYVMGRRMFDSGEEPWGESPPFRAPVFVVTHREREPLVRKGGTTFHFVTDGLKAAIERAKTMCGDQHVHISGGAAIVQQAIAQRLVNEMHVHIAPVLLGQGTRLFDQLPDSMVELDRFRVVDSPAITHLGFRFPTAG
ncbi:dihydrofolate reductase family protein [Nocardia sp. NPDC101769]|uniref:dihydrofolate reductase family protein n=1 Tax=Nocardia sp. NPDC101769 TaxID=3364333 RepID=UPI0038039F4A